MDSDPDRQRLDKWLWFARFVKTRPLAVRLVGEGRVRVNGARVDAPGRALRRGDVLTLTLPQGVRVVRVDGFAERRGPAPEARMLYDDMSGTPGGRDMP